MPRSEAERERVRRLQELRRGNAARPVRNRKVYRRADHKRNDERDR